MQRLKELRNSKNLSLRELGAMLDVAESTVSLYESGKREAPYSILKKLVEIFGVSTDYLLGVEQKTANSVFVPVLDSISFSENDLEFICNSQKECIDLGGTDTHFFFRAHDDSMQPHISEGDIVLVKRQSDVESGSIAAVVYENSPVTLKKIVKDGDVIALVPLNQDYQNIFIKNKDELIILGKVTQSIKKW